MLSEQIKTILYRSASAGLCFYWTWVVFVTWKAGFTNMTLGLLFAAGISAYLVWKRTTLSDARFLIYLTSAYATVSYAKIFFSNAIAQHPVIHFFVGSVDARGALDYIFLVLVCYALAWIVGKRTSWKMRRTNVWLYLHLAVSIGLSLYAGGLMLLEYESFRAPFFDFAIFDQALYQLSTFHAPASSARQFVNLWYDHQHFSLVLLAPLYWIRPIATQLLILITPFLLITFPSLILYKIFTLVQNMFVASDTNKKHYWVIGLSSFLLWLHPYTQSAIAFYFHEKYLMPVMFCLLLWALLKFLQRPSAWLVGAIMVLNLGWLGIKEDQWLFVLLFWIQMMLVISVFAKRLRKKVLIIGSISIVGCLLYAFALLPWYQQQSGSNPQYGKLYEQSATAFVEFTQDGDVKKFVHTLDLYDDVQRYLYQNFLVFDAPGMIAFPLNIAANYAERLLSSEYAIRNPAFHYGVDVPIYSVTGILLLMFVFHHRRKTGFERQIVFISMLYVLGFGSILGWNNDFYLHTRLAWYVDGFVESSELREDYQNIRDLIPKDASIVSTDSMAAHFSKRVFIAEYPQRIILPEGAPGRNDLDTYGYWILRTDFPLELSKASELQALNYRVLYRGKSIIVLYKQ